MSREWVASFPLTRDEEDTTYLSEILLKVDFGRFTKPKFCGCGVLKAHNFARRSYGINKEEKMIF